MTILALCLKDYSQHVQQGRKDAIKLQQIDRSYIKRGLLGGGAAVAFTANVVVAENALMLPFKVIAATDTLYTALGTKPFSVTLVLDVYTVMGGLPVSLVSWYLTL